MPYTASELVICESSWYTFKIIWLHWWASFFTHRLFLCIQYLRAIPSALTHDHIPILLICASEMGSCCAQFLGCIFSVYKLYKWALRDICLWSVMSHWCTAWSCSSTSMDGKLGGFFNHYLSSETWICEHVLAVVGCLV